MTVIGWHGKGMWVVIIRRPSELMTVEGRSYDIDPCFGMKTAGGTMQPGWLPSQADLLADDWVVVQPASA